MRVLVAAVCCAMVLAGCATTHGTPAEQLSQWVDGASYVSARAQLLEDLAFVTRAQHARQLLAMRTDCGGLTADVGAVYGTLPAPDHAFNADLVTMTTELGNAAYDCTNATSFRSAGYARFLRELVAGRAALSRADARAARLGVRVGS